MVAAEALRASVARRESSTLSVDTQKLKVVAKFNNMQGKSLYWGLGLTRPVNFGTVFPRV